jgi:hypothetical protein
MHLRLGKQHGTMRKTKHRGIAAVSADFMLNLTAYNLVRIPKLIAAEAESARKPENQLRQTENPTTNEETAWLPQVFSANC